ncbi:MAG: DUF4349 domain-containing protein, partial [Solirubrobacterales bacterium]|nr:DUF4349 domain-containing protein [Solirubrobacterales bacterium]
LQPRRVAISAGALASTVAVVALVVNGGAGVPPPESSGGGESSSSLEDSSTSAGAPVEPTASQAEAGETGGVAIEEAPEPGRVGGSFDATNDAGIANGSVTKISPFSRRLPGGGELLPARDQRKLERDADLTLAAPAEDVPGVANRVVGVVNAHDGIVETSEVTGRGKRAEARFSLAIPSSELDATIDDLSGLANVAALSEGSTDITEPFVSRRARLADDRTQLRAVRAQLAEAATPEEAADIRAQVDRLREEVAETQASYQNIARRARLAEVDVAIISRNGQPIGGKDGGGGAWGISDALDDAGRVLVVSGGVLLVAAAALIPIALLIALVLWIRSLLTKRARELALDA